MGRTVNIKVMNNSEKYLSLEGRGTERVFKSMETVSNLLLKKRYWKYFIDTLPSIPSPQGRGRKYKLTR